MHSSSRRNFIKTGAGLMGLAISGTSFDLLKKKPLLSFSTLGCPKWSFPAIIDCAVQNGYDGIEIRGIMGQVDLTKCPEFSSKENTSATRKTAEDKNITIAGLGASAELHHMDAAVRQRNMDGAKRFIDLAHQLNCPYVRVFPNRLPKEQERNATIDLISKGLLELGDYARQSNVSVLLESHGDVVETAVLKTIMESAAHPHTGLVWDVFNMWSVTKELPAQVYPQLKKYIRHTHIKDGKLIDGKIQYVLLGKGECPVFEAIDLLYKDDYKGYYSFEWEKLWHPEIEEPELAIPDYAKVMKAHFK
jgi:sugar phosphate isomerase/epimerase